jgi:hypothetical protein
MDRRRHLRALTACAIALALAAGGCGRRTNAADGASVPVDGGAGDAAAHGDESAAVPVGARASRVFVANHGKLVGAFEGFAWVAGADGVRIDEPRVCDERACFRGTDGLLCTRGAIPARRCSGADAGSGAGAQACRRNAFGVKLGFDVRPDGRPWSAAAKRYVSIEYRAAKRLRLAAHRSGDRDYCVDGYRSGEFVDARRFHADCGEGGGEVLPSFEDVDKLTLEQPATDEATSFDYCITAIAVGDDADASAGGAP